MNLYDESTLAESEIVMVHGRIKRPKHLIPELKYLEPRTWGPGLSIIDADDIKNPRKKAILSCNLMMSSTLASDIRNPNPYSKSDAGYKKRYSLDKENGSSSFCETMSIGDGIISQASGQAYSSPHFNLKSKAGRPKSFSAYNGSHGEYSDHATQENRTENSDDHTSRRGGKRKPQSPTQWRWYSTEPVETVSRKAVQFPIVPNISTHNVRSRITPQRIYHNEDDEILQSMKKGLQPTHTEAHEGLRTEVRPSKPCPLCGSNSGRISKTKLMMIAFGENQIEKKALARGALAMRALQKILI